MNEILFKLLVWPAVGGGAIVFYGVLGFAVKEIIESYGQRFHLFGWNEVVLTEQDELYLSRHDYDLREDYLEKLLLKNTGSMNREFYYNGKTKRFFYKN